jgi:ribosomal protein S18 acetylase RimI-like enzyme
MADALDLRPLVAADWPDAVHLFLRAFTTEPFVLEMFGPDPVGRFARVVRAYGGMSRDENGVHLGAFVEGVLVGMCLMTRPGRCRPCAADPASPPEEAAARLDWQFELNTAEAHSALGPHARISQVAVEPALQGGGLGRRLVAAALATAGAEGIDEVVLECQPHRSAFYQRCGFEPVSTFPDPVGPDAVLLRFVAVP